MKSAFFRISEITLRLAFRIGIRKRDAGTDTFRFALSRTGRQRCPKLRAAEKGQKIFCENFREIDGDVRCFSLRSFRICPVHFRSRQQRVFRIGSFFQLVETFSLPGNFFFLFFYQTEITAECVFGGDISIGNIRGRTIFLLHFGAGSFFGKIPGAKSILRTDGRNSEIFPKTQDVQNVHLTHRIKASPVSFYLRRVNQTCALIAAQRLGRNTAGSADIAELQIFFHKRYLLPVFCFYLQP